MSDDQQDLVVNKTSKMEKLGGNYCFQRSCDQCVLLTSSPSFSRTNGKNFFTLTLHCRSQQGPYAHLQQPFQQQQFRPHSSFHPGAPASAASSQHNMSRSNSASQRSIASQRSSSQYSVSSQQQQRAPGRAAVHSYPGPPNVARQPTGNSYTNVPSTKRSMLRNDEMYEMYPGTNGNGTRRVTSNSNIAHNTHAASNTSMNRVADPRQSNPSLPTLQQSPGVARRATPQRGAAPPGGGAPAPGGGVAAERTPRSARTSSSNLAGTPGEAEHSGDSSTEDEIWRAQLYQASIKLQKTPSEKRKGGAAQQVKIGDHSPTCKLGEF